MSERSKLEQVLELLLAEDNERAEELLHEYVVETARSEYERILDEDEVVEETESEEEEAVEESEESEEEAVEESEESEEDAVEEAIDASDPEADFVSDVEDADADIEADEVEFQKLLSEININIFYVDKKYKDNGPVYNRDSYMWSGQSDEKIINNMYRQKLTKYNGA